MTGSSTYRGRRNEYVGSELRDGSLASIGNGVRATRRAFLARAARAGAGGLALGLLRCSGPSETAPPTKRVYTIGLVGGIAPLPGPSQEAFLAGLRELGYREGEDFQVERRVSAAGEGPGDMRAAAAELGRVRADVILLGGAGLNGSLWYEVIAGTPVVHPFINAVEIGGPWIQSMAHPGGNVTGIASEVAGLSAKRLELLRELLPRATRVAHFRPGQPGLEIEEAAQMLGMELRAFGAVSAGQLESAYREATAWGAEAAVLSGWPPYFRQRGQVVGLAAREALPTVYPDAGYVASGGLMAFGANVAEQYRRAAVYVDKILRGAEPGALPIEQPTKFDLAVNLKTAEQLGLGFPASILNQATEVIR